MGPAIGIDLGTTNSVIAHINSGGRAEVIPNAEGCAITPSVVCFSTDPPLVGELAKERQSQGDDSVASFFKRSMGDSTFVLCHAGRDWTPTDLSALVLKKLKFDAEMALRTPIREAVITVPAYFNDDQRKATIAAGQIAGLEILCIINEPTAAALAYRVLETGKTDNVLVYDLGGGTFDVSLVRLSPEELTVLATDGDHALGGKDWDDRIANYFAGCFAAEHGVNPLADNLASNEILVLAERAKKALGDRQVTRVTIHHGGRSGTYELTRGRFEELTRDLMERTQRLCELVLQAKELTWDDLTGVLLVGGSTRMPMVQTYASCMSGKRPMTGVNVDEVVALGAAAMAARKINERSGSTTFALGAFRRTNDVTSHSLGVIVESEDRSRFVNSVVLRRNTPVPASGEKEYAIVPIRGELECSVYVTEGDGTDPQSVAVRGRYRCHGKIRGSREKPRIGIRYGYDANNTIQVSARLLDGDAPLDVVQEPVGDLEWLLKAPRDLHKFDPSNLNLVVTLPGFDDIGEILRTLRLSYRTWDGTPCADILFLNCGSEALPESSELRAYVEHGGCVYASDLTYTLIQEAFSGLFRFTGMTGDIGRRKADVVDSELQRQLGKSLTVEFDMPGWAEIAGVSSGCQVLLADHRTGRPLMAVGKIGKGKVFYTSFHNRSQASDTERHLLQVLVAKQISVVSGVPIEIVTRHAGIAMT